MQFLISILSETKIVIGILLALAIHGVANAAIPQTEAPQVNILETGCGQNIITLDDQENTVTKVCRATVVGAKINLLTLSYANGTSERFTIVRDHVISDSGSAAVHELTLRAYGSNSAETSMALETVKLGGKDVSEQANLIVQIKGVTPNHINFDARTFKVTAPTSTSAQTETL